MKKIKIFYNDGREAFDDYWGHEFSGNYMIVSTSEDCRVIIELAEILNFEIINDQDSS